ncbi:uncharacterized protein CCOS01_16523 [Colletotrichum costaricense]|uniref:Uncharacterized protein n=1 Tax=Colletotrichum costaricense TaxID=1209916 RepID=A0AAI9YFC3_9PEZI|nr:uncharacterized protein CCOS01_16523 [Colletotrichum costaricense]KAK1506471.1 hypothetical protein CCOS01_16523 [Colletotrichum costaricense]
MSLIPDHEVVNKLRKRYSSLDGKLEYIPDHMIHTKYTAYKHAHAEAKASNTTYKNTAHPLGLRRPYPPGQIPNGTTNNGFKYSVESHQILAPLAGTASSNAQTHADRRGSFNDKYKNVVAAKDQ